MPILKNIKHEAFADEYVNNGGNGRLAYQKAYPNAKNSAADSNSSRLLKNDKVLARIKEMGKKIEHKQLVTKEEILNSLKEVYRKCMQKEDVYSVDDKGKTTSQKERFMKESGALKALEMMGKTIGLFSDKIDHNHLVQTYILDKKEYTKTRKEMINADEC